MRTRLILALTALGAVTVGAAITIGGAAPPALAQTTGGFDFTRPQVAASNLQVPWGMAFLPDGSALVAERNTARILQFRPGTTPVQVATVSGVAPGGEAGLLGIAVSPSFAQDNLVFAYFTSSSDNRIVRFRLDAPTNQQPILTGIPRNTIHDGGRIAFGPDGLLYVGAGDAGNSANAQNLQSLGGKILRMRPDGTVPPDNPFAGSLVYSYGHRNVQGLAWDAQGRLYATEFGQNTWDEINQIVADGNYGWPTVEGRGNDPRFRDPIVVWATAESSPSGAAIANNHLFAAALRGTRLWVVPLNGSGGANTPVAELNGQYGRLRTVALGPDGWLWVATSNRDGRGTPAASDDRVIRFPPVGATSPPPTTSLPTSTPPTTSFPTSTPPNTSPPPPGSTGCAVTYRVVNQWAGGFQAEVTVRNTGPSPSRSWRTGWTFPNGQTITQLWRGVVQQSGARVQVDNANYNGTVPPDGTTTFGFTGTWNNITNGPPTDLTCGAG